MLLTTASYCLFLKDCVWAHSMKTNVDTGVSFQILWSTNEAVQIEHGPWGEGCALPIVLYLHHLTGPPTKEGLNKCLLNWTGLSDTFDQCVSPCTRLPYTGWYKLTFVPWKSYVCLHVILTDRTGRHCMAPCPSALPARATRCGRQNLFAKAISSSGSRSKVGDNCLV